ncbi:DUF4837 family protein [Flavobacterium crassostreae]|uniref:Endonuclease n=1 Tax=Flavobacterium crassostreae TaxID=1763534 RepID=A0A1B9E0H6_9FLAO|nr:DUF4837 family protein [Flavobacterium crassostreae]OCB75440.1 endonuclease [Flavobacterium crassostreae]
MIHSPFLVVLLALLFYSCQKENAKNSTQATNPINTISILIEDQLWNGEVGDSIRNKFASPVIGLPQEEPLFTINQYPVKLMEGFIADSRNIILIKRDAQNHFYIKKDTHAKAKNIFCISGKSTAAIIKIIENKAPEIIQTIKATEIKESQLLIRNSLSNAKKAKNKFQLKIQIPENYQCVLEQTNFIWFKKEIVSGNSSLLLYKIPLSSNISKENLVASLIKARDSIGNLYIHGKEPDTAMITEEAYAPYFFKIQLDGKLAYEMKGTWVLKNDFMSGPFITYALMDPKNNSAWILEGFCYSPSKEKRDLMHELEAIIKSVQVMDK